MQLSVSVLSWSHTQRGRAMALLARGALVVGASLAVTSVACVKNGPPRCVAGEIIACACPGGGEGTQVCTGGGSYGACTCSGDSVGQGATPSQAAGPVEAGHCVGDVLAHALAQSRIALQDNTLQPSRLSRYAVSDVDGDGVDEIVISDVYAGTDHTLYFLYLSGNGCVRYVTQAWASADFDEAAPELRAVLGAAAGAPQPGGGVATAWPLPKPVMALYALPAIFAGNQYPGCCFDCDQAMPVLQGLVVQLQSLESSRDPAVLRGVAASFRDNDIVAGKISIDVDIWPAFVVALREFSGAVDAVAQDAERGRDPAATGHLGRLSEQARDLARIAGHVGQASELYCDED